MCREAARPETEAFAQKCRERARSRGVSTQRLCLIAGADGAILSLEECAGGRSNERRAQGPASLTILGTVERVRTVC
jgi:hypothetical protein